MKVRDGRGIPTLLAAFSAALLAWACETPVEIEPSEGLSAPSFAVDCTERPDHPHCGPADPGPGATIPISLTGAIVSAASTDVDVERNNGSTLELGGGAHITGFRFPGSIGACVTDGVFGGEKVSEAFMRSLLAAGDGFEFSSLVIDKTSASSADHVLVHHWDDGTINGDIVTWIASATRDRKTAAPSTGDPDPLVVTEADTPVPGATRYTFVADNGVLYIKQRYARPRDHPRLVCPLPQDVVITVGP